MFLFCNSLVSFEGIIDGIFHASSQKSYWFANRRDLPDTDGLEHKQKLSLFWSGPSGATPEECIFHFGWTCRIQGWWHCLDTCVKEETICFWSRYQVVYEMGHFPIVFRGCQHEKILVSRQHEVHLWFSNRKCLNVQLSLSRLMMNMKRSLINCDTIKLMCQHQ